MTDLVERLREMRIVPVITIQNAEDAVPLAAALTAGGLPCAEITFRTAAGAEALRRIAGENPEMLVGAGTVLTVAQAEEARAAGAKFVVTPGFNPVVVDFCQEHGIPVYPGICTPTELDMALAKGLKTVKFFPAEPMGGLPFLKAIAAPYHMVQFIPTGGVKTTNVADYLSFKNVVACGGTWMAPADWITGKQFERIQQETAAAVAAVRGA
jgi:2-dehydro-3-deoxyphosphogluconate aldolase/(4S)-4-hydroxy-2-oxoglutarate aldolase